MAALSAAKAAQGVFLSKLAQPAAPGGDTAAQARAPKVAKPTALAGPVVPGAQRRGPLQARRAPVPAKVREYRAAYPHQHSGAFAWPKAIALAADFTRSKVLQKIGRSRPQHVAYGSVDHVEPFVACCACGEVWAFDLASSVCPACEVDLADHVSTRVAFAAGDLARVFGRKKRAAAKAERSRSRSRSKGRPRANSKARPVKVSFKIGAKEAKARSAKAPALPPKPASARVEPQRGRAQSERPKGSKDQLRFEASIMDPSNYGHIKWPDSGEPVPTGSANLDEVIPWTSLNPALVATVVSPIPPGEGLFIVKRDALNSLIYIDPAIGSDAVNSIAYVVMLQSGDTAANELVLIYEFFPDGSPDSGDVVYPLDICYLESSAGYQPYGDFCPAFVDRLQEQGRSGVFMQPGTMLTITVSMDTDWFNTLGGMCQFSMLAYAYNQGEWILFGRIGSGVENGGSQTVTLDFQGVNYGYYAFELVFGEAAGGAAGSTLTISMDLNGDTSTYGTPLSMVNMFMSPSIANAISAQFQDIRATGISLLGTQAGQNLERNGTFYARQFQSDVSWTDLLAPQPELGLDGTYGCTKLATYPSFMQHDLIEGFYGWVKPDSEELSSFRKSLACGADTTLVRALSPLRDQGWFAIGIALDDGVQTKLSLRLGVGFEFVATDKTRKYSTDRGSPAAADLARRKLRAIKPEQQFSANNDHMAMIIGNLLGKGAKALGGAIGGDVGNAISTGGQYAGALAGQLGSILGDLI